MSRHSLVVNLITSVTVSAVATGCSWFLLPEDYRPKPAIAVIVGLVLPLVGGASSYLVNESLLGTPLSIADGPQPPSFEGAGGWPQTPSTTVDIPVATVQEDYSEEPWDEDPEPVSAFDRSLGL